MTGIERMSTAFCRHSSQERTVLQSVRHTAQLTRWNMGRWVGGHCYRAPVM